jgi:hypothetical protein
MMRILRVLASVCLCWATTVAYAGASVVRPLTIHEVAFDGCHFNLRDAYNGKIKVSTDGSSSVANYHAEINPKARHPFGTWIQFYCEKKGIEKAFKSMGMKNVDSRWVLDQESYSPLPEEHVAIYPLRGNPWSGAGLSGDQTTGDEDQRMRSFGFCISGAKQVLCGSIQQVMFLTSPKESTIPQVIQLLQSIEFIDDASNAPVEEYKAPMANH